MGLGFRYVKLSPNNEREATYVCPHCGEDSAFDPWHLHAGCTFACEHCGGQSVIEPRAVEAKE